MTDTAEGTNSSAQMLTYTEAAAFLNVPRGTLHAWVHDRRVPHVRLGPRTVRFVRADLDAWVAQRRVDASGRGSASQGRS